jgi:hypothetical protein
VVALCESPTEKAPYLTPAAVRGHAGPDRAVADTHGIGRRWPAQATESVYKGLGKEKCCKSGGISGNFGGAGADLRLLGALLMKIVSQCREQEEWVQDRHRV